MIINICGSSGSGKSSLVRQLMSQYPIRIPLQPENRKRPVAYTCGKHCYGNNLFVLGHYETACGGCDTLASWFPDGMLHEIYEWIRAAHTSTTNIIYEGLLIESDVKRAINLHKDGYPFVAVFLNTSKQLCLDSVRMRREANGNFKPLNPKNTLDRVRQCIRRRERLINEGDCHTEYLSREDALTFCQTELGLQRIAIPLPEIPKPEPEIPKPEPKKEESKFDFSAFLDGK